MKEFLKGAAIVVAVLLVLMAINIVGNLNGINMDSLSNGPVWALCAVMIYRDMVRDKKEKGDK